MTQEYVLELIEFRVNEALGLGSRDDGVIVSADELRRGLYDVLAVIREARKDKAPIE